MIATLVTLLGSFVLVLGVQLARGRERASAARDAGRFGLAALFLVTGVGHFTMAEAMAEMVPPPLPPEATVSVSGVLEILGAIGLLFEKTRRWAAWGLFALLIAVFPANVYAALERTGLGGHVEGPTYLLTRAPLQALFLAWTWYFGIRRG